MKTCARSYFKDDLPVNSQSNFPARQKGVGLFYKPLIDPCNSRVFEAKKKSKTKRDPADIIAASYRAWNNFPTGVGQVVRSNLFSLGHNPFLAGQTSITSYLCKIAPPPAPLHDVYISNKYIFYAFIGCPIHPHRNGPWHPHTDCREELTVCNLHLISET